MDGLFRMIRAWLKCGITLCLSYRTEAKLALKNHFWVLVVYRISDGLLFIQSCLYIIWLWVYIGI